MGADVTGRVNFTVQGAVAWLRFDNPGKRNAMTLQMWQDLTQAVARVAADDSLRALVLTGAGDDAFVSGSDISGFAESRSSAAAAADYAAAVEQALADLARLPKPTIAAIRGYCIGGGVSIAVAADLRLAAAGAVFAIPAGRLGIGYSMGQIGRLQALAGPALTREMIFLARRLDAAEAERRGLINRAVPDAGFDAELTQWVQAVSDNAPLTLAAAKRASLALGATALPGDHDRAEAAIAACILSADYQEGQQAFAQKRPPVFQGR